MKAANVAIIYRKELLDSLRDRRTLISMVVVPILLFPLMTIGFGALAARQVQRVQEETPTIMLLGAEHAPALAAAIRKAEGFQVVPPAADYVARINDKKLRAAVEFPPGFEEKLKAGDSPPPAVTLYYYAGEIRSSFAQRSLQNILNNYRDRIVEQRLATRGLSRNLLKPFESREQNVASPEKVGGAMFGAMMPYFIIILCLTGAMYPAIDLTAGEKERGTIETILASPVHRTELVAGKFLMVLTASLSTAILSLTSFATTFSLPLKAVNQLARIGRGGMPFVISVKGAAAVFLMVVPLAVFFSAGLLAISLLARSYKEAQTYVSPLMIVAILPAAVAMLPGIELNTKLALIPSLNVSLVSKEILSGNYPWGMIALIFGSSCFYAAVAFLLAVHTFQRESVLFRT